MSRNQSTLPRRSTAETTQGSSAQPPDDMVADSKPVAKPANSQGGKHKSWNPFAKKDYSTYDFDAHITKHQTMADSETTKQMDAETHRQSNANLMRSKEAPMGSRFAAVFKRFGNWTSAKSHGMKSSRELKKADRIRTRRDRELGGGRQHSRGGAVAAQ